MNCVHASSLGEGSWRNHFLLQIGHTRLNEYTVRMEILAVRTLKVHFSLSEFGLSEFYPKADVKVLALLSKNMELPPNPHRHLRLAIKRQRDRHNWQDVMQMCAFPRVKIARRIALSITPTNEM